MSIPVRIRNIIEAEVTIIGIDIPNPKSGAAFLVVERVDNQVKYSFRLGIPNEFVEPPLPSDSEEI